MQHNCAKKFELCSIYQLAKCCENDIFEFSSFQFFLFSTFFIFTCYPNLGRYSLHTSSCLCQLACDVHDFSEYVITWLLEANHSCNTWSWKRKSIAETAYLLSVFHGGKPVMMMMTMKMTMTMIRIMMMLMIMIYKNCDRFNK